MDLPPSGDASVDMVLSALISIRDAISSLVPHRADWAAELAAHIDPSLLRGMMLARAFGPPDWLALMRYVGGKLQALEAPVRGEETRAWLEAAQAHVKRLSARQQQRQQEAQPQYQRKLAFVTAAVSASSQSRPATWPGTLCCIPFGRHAGLVVHTDNQVKETLWQLSIYGMRMAGAGGHGVLFRQPCPCG